MKYTIKQKGNGDYLYEPLEKTTVRDFLTEIFDEGNPCYIIVGNYMYKYNGKHLNMEVPAILQHTEIECISVVEKYRQPNLRENWYTLNLKEYADDSVSDEDVFKMGNEFMKHYNRYLDILTKRIFKNSCIKITDIEKFGCVAKGPYITYRYVRTDGNYEPSVIDEDFGIFYLKDLL